MKEFHYAPEAVKDEWFSLMDDISTASLKVQKEKWQHFTPDFVDVHSGSVDITGAMQAAEVSRDLYTQQKISQLEGEAKIKTTMPITLFPIGDIHWGSVYTNNKLWEYHRRTILETPGAYVVFLHNLVDNGIKYSVTNAISNGVPPWEQFRVMQSWIKELDSKGKVLGGIFSDCHEGWSWNVAGIEAEKLLYGYEGRNFPVIENGGVLNIEIGSEKYSLGLWHKQGPFNSRFNPEHALRQNRRLNHDGKTDGEIGAHYHNASASANYEGGVLNMKPVQYIRVGTYKGVPFVLGEKDYITDKWSIEKFGTSGQMPGTSIMFWDKKHNTDNSIDFETAIEKHMAIRTVALLKEMGMYERFAKLIK